VTRGMWRPFRWLLVVLVLLPAAHAAAQAPKAVPTEAFVVHAAGLIKFEVASSQLALRKTRNDTVQAFAHQIYLDHSAASLKFRQAVAEARLPPPRDALDEAHKVLSDDLAHTAPGKAFAKAYVEAQYRALREATKFFEVYAKSGDNERLQLFAQEMVPLLRSQFEQAEKLHR
jgi:putative membrane protein